MYHAKWRPIISQSVRFGGKEEEEEEEEEKGRGVFDKTDGYRFTDRGIRRWIHGPETMTSLFSWKRGWGRNGDVTSCGVAGRRWRRSVHPTLHLACICAMTSPRRFLLAGPADVYPVLSSARNSKISRLSFLRSGRFFTVPRRQ